MSELKLPAASGGGSISIKGPASSGSDVDLLDTSGNLNLEDNKKLKLGTSDDLQIYFDGSNSYIKEGVATAVRWKEEHPQIDCFVVDPSSAGLRASMRNVGLDAIPANNAVFTGIQSVAGRLCNDPSGKPKLVVHRKCSNLLREFGSYEWMSNQDGSNKDQPKKEHDHALDALRYSIVHIDGLRSTPSIRSIDGIGDNAKMNPLFNDDLWTEW